jgi:hypothetical protein
MSGLWLGSLRRSMAGSEYGIMAASHLFLFTDF